MKFTVVQTRKKNAKPSITVVPTRWIEGDLVKFPKTDWVKKSHDAENDPGDDCVSFPIKVIGRANSYIQADQLMDKLEEITDSDDALNLTRGTRGVPAKKIKNTFTSRSFTGTMAMVRYFVFIVLLNSNLTSTLIYLPTLLQPISQEKKPTLFSAFGIFNRC